MAKEKNTISKKSVVSKKVGVQANKEKPKKIAVTPTDASNEDVEIFSGKEKVVIEIEEREDVLTPIDKLVADPLLEPVAAVDGAESEDAGLDEEEVDPFSDKWEI